MSDVLPRSTRTGADAPAAFVRPVGALERQFYSYAQRNPVHFSTVAEFAVALDERSVRVALEAVQRRHPLLSAHVQDHAGVGFYRAPEVAPIPLTVHRRLEAAWEPFVGEDLARPFDRSTGPLVRATMIAAPDTTALVLTFDHTFADGISSVEVLDDLLTVLNGGRLAALSVPPSAEEVIGKVLGYAETLPAPAADERMVRPTAVRPFDGAHPAIRTVTLGRADTQRLVSICRREQTTVHCAIVTAASAVQKAMAGPDFVRVLSPINIRGLVDADGDCAMYISCAVTGMAPGEDAFWSQARELAGQLAAARSAEGVRTLSAVMGQVVPRQADAATAHEFFTRVVPFDMLITNLGVHDLDGAGPIRPTALWGPVVRTHIEGDPGIGVATYEGRLRMVSTGYDTAADYLDRVADLLVKMCR
jgi:hypothetical protein